MKTYVERPYQPGARVMPCPECRKRNGCKKDCGRRRCICRGICGRCAKIIELSGLKLCL